MMKIKVLCLIALFTILVHSRPCTTCLGEGAYCGDDSGGSACFRGLKCTALKHGTAKVCVPTVSPGEACNNYPYDPCPNYYDCDSDTQTCVLTQGIASINDGCNINADCENSFFGITCTGGVCTAPSNISCTITDCPEGQFCDKSSIEPVCRNALLPGAACNNGVDKCFNGDCVNGLCQGYYSRPEGENCTDSKQCEVGLSCSLRDGIRACRAPSYYYISSSDYARWGVECDSSTGVEGCTCNYASGVEQFAIEMNTASREPCKNALYAFSNCMKENACYSQSTFENSCLSRNCYPELNRGMEECYLGGASPPRCSATSMFLALILVIAVLFLH